MREPGAAKSGRWVTINVSSGPQVSLLSSSVAVAEGADQRRDFHGRFDVRRLNNVHMIAAPEDSVATAFSGLTPPNETAGVQTLRRRGRGRRAKHAGAPGNDDRECTCF